MKSSSLLKIALMAVLAFALSTSCKNPNATQETDGQTIEGATPAEVTESATDTTAEKTTTRVNDLEGSDGHNN